jgi:hypothetical protein
MPVAGQTPVNEATHSANVLVLKGLKSVVEINFPCVVDYNIYFAFQSAEFIIWLAKLSMAEFCFEEFHFRAFEEVFKASLQSSSHV